MAHIAASWQETLEAGTLLPGIVYFWAEIGGNHVGPVVFVHLNEVLVYLGNALRSHNDLDYGVPCHVCCGVLVHSPSLPPVKVTAAGTVLLTSRVRPRYLRQYRVLVKDVEAAMEQWDHPAEERDMTDAEPCYMMRAEYSATEFVPVHVRELTFASHAAVTRAFVEFLAARNVGAVDTGAEALAVFAQLALHGRASTARFFYVREPAWPDGELCVIGHVINDAPQFVSTRVHMVASRDFSAASNRFLADPFVRAVVDTNIAQLAQDVTNDGFDKAWRYTHLILSNQLRQAAEIVTHASTLAAVECDLYALLPATGGNETLDIHDTERLLVRDPFVVLEFRVAAPARALVKLAKGAEPYAALHVVHDWPVLTLSFVQIEIEARGVGYNKYLFDLLEYALLVRGTRAMLCVEHCFVPTVDLMNKRYGYVPLLTNAKYPPVLPAFQTPAERARFSAGYLTGDVYWYPPLLRASYYYVVKERVTPGLYAVLVRMQHAILDREDMHNPGGHVTLSHGATDDAAFRDACLAAGAWPHLDNDEMQLNQVVVRLARTPRAMLTSIVYFLYGLAASLKWEFHVMWDAMGGDATDFAIADTAPQSGPEYATECYERGDEYVLNKHFIETLGARHVRLKCLAKRAPRIKLPDTDEEEERVVRPAEHALHVIACYHPPIGADTQIWPSPPPSYVVDLLNPRGEEAPPVEYLPIPREQPDVSDDEKGVEDELPLPDPWAQEDEEVEEEAVETLRRLAPRKKTSHKKGMGPGPRQRHGPSHRTPAQEAAAAQKRAAKEPARRQAREEAARKHRRQRDAENEDDDEPSAKHPRFVQCVRCERYVSVDMSVQGQWCSLTCSSSK